MSVDRQGNSDIEQDVAWERKWHRFERLMWTLMTLLLVAACAGAIGEGPLSTATASSGPLRVEYPRLLHARSPAEIKVYLAPEATKGGEAQLVISGALAGRAAVQSSTPSSSSSEAISETQVRTAWKVTVGRSATIRLRHMAERPGALVSTVGLSGGEQVELNQIVLP